MDFVRSFPLFSIVLSLFSGVLCTMLDGKKAERYTTVYELFLIVLNGAVLRYVLQTGESFTYVMGEFPGGPAGTLFPPGPVLFRAGRTALCAAGYG